MSCHQPALEVEEEVQYQRKLLTPLPRALSNPRCGCTAKSRQGKQLYIAKPGVIIHPDEFEDITAYRFCRVILRT